MVDLTQNVSVQASSTNTAKDIFLFIQGSPVSIIFLLFLFLSGLLNLIKWILIGLEKKQASKDARCINLTTESGEQSCGNPNYRKYFKENANGCDGCPGRTSGLTNVDAESRAYAKSIWMKMIILLANYCKVLLPYASFLYTLLLAVFQSQS